ncbi:hypothetical protein C1J03_05325 [Sulfitobacter sp. SK012]|nr:hypothetical protein C1J03_05325 [Sulfitobacter sp. SK012]
MVRCLFTLNLNSLSLFSFLVKIFSQRSFSHHGVAYRQKAAEAGSAKAAIQRWQLRKVITLGIVAHAIAACSNPKHVRCTNQEGSSVAPKTAKQKGDELCKFCANLAECSRIVQHIWMLSLYVTNTIKNLEIQLVNIGFSK